MSANPFRADENVRFRCAEMTETIGLELCADISNLLVRIVAENLAALEASK